MESCSPTADVELPTSPPHNHPEKKNRQPQTVPPTNYNNKLWTVTCLKGIMGKCISKYHYLMWSINNFNIAASDNVEKT